MRVIKKMNRGGSAQWCDGSMVLNVFCILRLCHGVGCCGAAAALAAAPAAALRWCHGLVRRCHGVMRNGARILYVYI